VTGFQKLREDLGLKPLAFAKCFYASAENELVLMENLKEQQFGVVEKKPQRKLQIEQKKSHIAQNSCKSNKKIANRTKKSQIAQKSRKSNKKVANRKSKNLSEKKFWRGRFGCHNFPDSFTAYEVLMIRGKCGKQLN
jgi:hypothetical protein